jgi:hypothetical protein
MFSPPKNGARNLYRNVAAISPGFRLAGGGSGIRTAGPPVKRDGVFRDHPDRPPPPLLPENQARGTEGSNPLPSSEESRHEPEIRSAARAISSLIWLPCSGNRHTRRQHRPVLGRKHGLPYRQRCRCREARGRSAAPTLPASVSASTARMPGPMLATNSNSDHGFAATSARSRSARTTPEKFSSGGSIATKPRPAGRLFKQCGHDHRRQGRRQASGGGHPHRRALIMKAELATLPKRRGPIIKLA